MHENARFQPVSRQLSGRGIAIDTLKWEYGSCTHMLGMVILCSITIRFGRLQCLSGTSSLWSQGNGPSTFTKMG